MKKKLLPQLDNVYEDQETLQMLRDYERGKFKPVKNQAAAKAMLAQAAGRYLAENNLDHKGRKKDSRVNIRMSGYDVDKIKHLAADEGLPYQTLIASVLHKFANGSLKDARLPLLG